MSVVSNVDFQAFASEWIEAWNSHDLNRILHHYSEEVVFESPFISRVLGDSHKNRLVGKSVLSHYWRAALDRFPDLEFILLGVYTSSSSICIHYRTVLSKTAIEWMKLDERGRVIESTAHYDA